ncbi:Tigger transposable element-derived protein [Thalictrum thalictroides]|uniref:Tigger transposable element-derived protein n=1 Tax=Thalictrum thalictroides TaxID=46969 RepID=A0A7J6VNH2_THATH|nr:Tigger transposable element-derived protein [Thalictrum thalictroides]
MSVNQNGKRLNESERCEIISKLSSNNPPSKRSVARQYGVSEGAIRKVWINRESITTRSAQFSDETKKQTYRAAAGRWSDVENKLYLWIDSMRRAKLPVPPSLAIAKAKSIASALSIPETEFKASWQWLSRFRARHGLNKMLLHGECAEVDKDDPELLASLDNLYELINKFEHENVYNMDETGLFFRLLPRYSILMPQEDIATTRGKKKSKDRISLIVCANATGTHKISCSFIGKPKEPACIKNRIWPVPYFNQAKAWMDVETCWKWFEQIFVPEVRSRTGRRVLLLMDNAPGHFEAFERNGITVAFFPPNCTSWKQPCDMGIIAALKKRYKYLYLKDVLDFYELDAESKHRKQEEGKRMRRGAAGVAYGNPAHLLDAALYVKQAWDSVSSVSIKNSFIKADIMNLTNEGQEIRDDLDQSFNNLGNMMQELQISINPSEMNDFLHIDDEDNEDFIQEIFADVEEVMESMQLANHEDEEQDTELNSEIEASVEQRTEFRGFASHYSTLLDVEDQLLCPESQAEAEESFDSLIQAFQKFKYEVQALSAKERRK